MKEKGKVSERERRDWIIILIILLFGFLCVILAGQWAVRFSPNWKLDTSMQSNLDPDSDFLTNRPAGYYEPLDPSILTQPVWINVFLTPGAFFETRVPVIPTNTPLGTNTPVPTLIVSPTTTKPPTNTPLVIFIPSTNTPIYYPPPTRTPNPPPTIVSPPSAVPVDLSIAKDDGVSTVNPGATITYTVRVTNSGPNNVAGALLSDPAATGLSKTAVACSPTPGQCITPPTVIQLENGAFGLPALNNGQFYEVTVSVTVNATSGSVTNTATVATPAGYTDTNSGNNSASDTDTVNQVADLRIAKTDNATHYVAGALKIYTITVFNDGPSDVTGAIVTDVFSSNTNIDSTVPVIWACLDCVPVLAGVGDINQAVNIPGSSSVTFVATVSVVSNPSGTLDNTATVTAPPGVNDPNPLNNSAADSDILIVPDPIPSGIITPGDGSVFNLLVSNSPLTLNFTTTVNGDLGTPDLVVYEFLNGSYVYLDWMIVEIGDGSNWYTVFYWGDEIRDTNTNMDYNLLPCPSTAPYPPGCPPGGSLYEPDQREIPPIYFYPYTASSSGITIDLDLPFIPQGTYPYIRITAPMGDADGQLEIDAIEVLP